MIIAGVSHTLHDHIADLTALDYAFLTTIGALVAFVIRLYINKLSSSEESITALTTSRVSKADFQEFRREVLEVMHRMETKVDNRLNDLTVRHADLSADVIVIERTVQHLERRDYCGYDETGKHTPGS